MVFMIESFEWVPLSVLFVRCLHSTILFSPQRRVEEASRCLRICWVRFEERERERETGNENIRESDQNNNVKSDPYVTMNHIVHFVEPERSIPTQKLIFKFDTGTKRGRTNANSSKSHLTRCLLTVNLQVDGQCEPLVLVERGESLHFTLADCQVYLQDCR